MLLPSPCAITFPFQECRCCICNIAHSNSNIYTTVVTAITSNNFNNGYTYTFRHTGSNIQQQHIKSLQCYHLLATTLHTITDSCTTFTYDDSIILWRQHCNILAIVVKFTSSNITHNNRHITYIMSTCCKTMKMNNSQASVYVC